jgi:hypothetical protein
MWWYIQRLTQVKPVTQQIMCFAPGFTTGLATILGYCCNFPCRMSSFWAPLRMEVPVPADGVTA